MNVQHPDLDELRSYFAQLPTKNLVNIHELHKNVYETCARYFLNGNQDEAFKNLIALYNRRVSNWRIENIDALNNPDLPKDELKRLDEDRHQIDYFILWANYDLRDIGNIVKFLNKQSHHRWIIKRSRWIKENSIKE